MELTNQLDHAIRSLEQWCSARDYAGSDPYDGLLSPAARLVPGKLGRQVLVQGVKRAPRGARAALGISRVRMAKALSLFARGYRRLPDVYDWERTGLPLIDELLDLRIPGEGWGYEFDVQTRWAFYPSGSSNIIVSSFVVEALFETGELARLDMDFWDWLERSMISHRGHVRYVPNSNHMIHNANVLGARTLLRSPVAHHHLLAATAIERTVADQRPDGSWPYGEDPSLGWIDNFHTVYVLEALRAAGQTGIDVQESLGLGIDYWHRTFMTHDPPAYLADGTGPVDLHNLSTAVLPFSWPEVAFGHSGSTTVCALLQYQRPNGEFRRSAWSPSFMRWANAHAFNALTSLRANR
jgi:hypothetical protein